MLGFHRVLKPEKSRTTSCAPHVLQAGDSSEARTSSSNSALHAWQRYTYIGTAKV
jgi:hypothetical protein